MYLLQLLLVNVCPCEPPTKSVLNEDDSANAFKVTTPFDAYSN